MDYKSPTRHVRVRSQLEKHAQKAPNKCAGNYPSGGDQAGEENAMDEAAPLSRVIHRPQDVFLQESNTTLQTARSEKYR